MIQLFGFLEDGSWHSLREMALKTKTPIEDLSDYCANLSKHGLVEYDVGARRVRIGRELVNMIAMLATCDRAAKKWRRMGVGTVIVPSEKSLEIQGILMQNMTEQDLKIEFTFNAKPIEIVISTV